MCVKVKPELLCSVWRFRGNCVHSTRRLDIFQYNSYVYHEILAIIAKILMMILLNLKGNV